MIATRDVDSIIGAEAIGPDEDRIGTVCRILVDERSALPTWAIVRTGVLGRSECAVPLERADWDERSLHVVVGRHDARSAPHLGRQTELSGPEEARLYAHYGIDPTDPACADGVCYSVHFEDAEA